MFIMIQFIIHWVLTALVLTLVAYILPGITIDGFGIALIATFVLSVVNSLIRPVLGFLTFPITVVTLGLFSFVLNAAMFGLAAWFVPGFEVHGFWWALLGSLLLSVMTGLLDQLMSSNDSAKPGPSPQV